jgi:hypothetical protein
MPTEVYISSLLLKKTPRISKKTDPFFWLLEKVQSARQDLVRWEVRMPIREQFIASPPEQKPISIFVTFRDFSYLGINPLGFNQKFFAFSQIYPDHGVFADTIDTHLDMLFMGNSAMEFRHLRLSSVRLKEEKSRTAHGFKEEITMHRFFTVLLGVGVGVATWMADSTAQAQPPTYQLNRFYYYPYYYFPHNYWPTMGPQWPEPPGMPYMRPPAYQAYPPFREPNWRYDLFHRQKYHQGFHFWLDQF